MSEVGGELSPHPSTHFLLSNVCNFGDPYVLCPISPPSTQNHDHLCFPPTTMTSTWGSSSSSKVVQSSRETVTSHDPAFSDAACWKTKSSGGASLVQVSSSAEDGLSCAKKKPLFIRMMRSWIKMQMQPSNLCCCSCCCYCFCSFFR